MIEISLAAIVMVLVYLLFELQREKRRNRILQSFLAGVIKSMSDYVSRTDTPDISSSSDIVKIYDRKFPIPYSELLQNVNREFQKDFWMKPYGKWIRKDRNLFYEGKYANDGFNMIYWDYFDQAAADIRKEKESQMNSQQGASPDRRDARGSQ